MEDHFLENCPEQPRQGALQGWLTWAHRHQMVSPGPPMILICISLSLWHPFFFSCPHWLSKFCYIQISFIPTEDKANMTGFCGNSPHQNAHVKMSKHSFYEQIEQQIFLPPTPSLTPFLIKPLLSTSHLCWIPLDLILNMTFLIDLLPAIQRVKYSKK